MIYREFEGMKLSALGFGAMRLPVIDGDDSRIDEETSQKMVDQAMAAGINYYDTAWGYHDGHSEEVLGRCLKKYDRNSYCIATKFPSYDLRNMPKVNYKRLKSLASCFTDEFLQSIPFGMNAEESASTGL